MLSSFDYIDETRGTYIDYGNIVDNVYYGSTANGEENLPQWAYEPIKKIIVYDDIAPKNMACWFSRSETIEDVLESIDLAKIHTNNVTDMQWLFRYREKLTSIDLSNFNTSKVSNMQEMFSECRKVNNLDVRNFNTANVTNMNQMFFSCNSITNLDCTSFNTLNVIGMGKMFEWCYSLVTLDISSFDTTNVTDMISIFSECRVLNTILVGPKWKVVEGTEGMFYNCATDKVTLKTT